MSYCRENQVKRRDVLLQEMGIIEWKLVKKRAIKGIVNIPIGVNIKLIIIVEQVVDKKNMFIQDVLRSLGLSEEECLIIDFNFLPYLNIEHQPNFLCLTDSLENINQFKALNLPSSMNWYSSSLSRLFSSAQQKRQLWQDMQKN